MQSVAAAIRAAGAAEPRRLAELAPPPSAPSAAVLVEHQVEAVAREVEALRSELAAVRRRDDALCSYLHRMDEELRMAARLQQDFLPKSLPQVGRVRFHALFRPAGYVSGDLYDVMRLDERRVGFYMADAVGHGVPAALLTMFIKQALQTKEIDPRGRGYRLLEPGEALRRLNERLLDQNLSNSTFATATYGVVDADTLEVTVARAGHPHPVVIRSGGAIEPLEVDGSLLGVFPDESYENYTTCLRPGDRLVVYSDGIELAFGDDCGDDERGDGPPPGPSRCGRRGPAWQSELLRRRHLPGEQLLADLSAALDAESRSLRPKDDLTLVIVEAVAG